MTDRALIFAGCPMTNPWLYRRAPFHMVDPMALILLPGGEAQAIVRDIEMGRFRDAKIAPNVACPKDFAPADGLSGDRETATAQAAAEFVALRGIREVWADRSLPLIFAHELQSRGVAVKCEPQMGVLERRSKSEEEVEHLRAAQQLTEQAVRFACEMVASASAGAGGVLEHHGETLSSEGLMAEINIWLLKHGMATCDSIVAAGPEGADCHNRGAGTIKTGEPVIIDIFPMHSASRYFGDCTRTVVHGEIEPKLARMHETVVSAKAAAFAATRPDATGQEVHEATALVIKEAGYGMTLPGPDDPDSYCAMVHGTGHGVGLEVHEPPLLDVGGPALVEGDCLTIEPGLYCKAIGGVRVEDMVIVTASGCVNLNSIPEGLVWA